MSTFTEQRVLKQVTILPQANTVQVQWSNQVLRGTEVISETFERKAYSADLTGFNTEVGALDVNAFLAAFNAATLDAKVEAVADKTTAETALATAQARIAELEAQVKTLVNLETQHLLHIDEQAERIANLEAAYDAMSNFLKEE